MTLRLPLSVALTGLLALAACDSATTTVGGVEVNDGEGVTGVYETTSTFRADTLLPLYNHRIKSDYRVHYRFDVVHDDGLAWGYLRTYFDGTLVVREAGYIADTLRFNPDRPVAQQMVGTFAWPTLELDHRGATDSESIWDFEKVASQLRLEGSVAHQWTFRYLNADSTEFDFVIPTVEPDFVAARLDGEEVQGFEPTDLSFLPFDSESADSVMTLTTARARLVLQPRRTGRYTGIGTGD